MGTRGRCLLASLTHQLLSSAPGGVAPEGVPAPRLRLGRLPTALLLAKANPGREGAGLRARTARDLVHSPGTTDSQQFLLSPLLPRCAQLASQAGHPNPIGWEGPTRLQPALGAAPGAARTEDEGWSQDGRLFPLLSALLFPTLVCAKRHPAFPSLLPPPLSQHHKNCPWGVSSCF